MEKVYQVFVSSTFSDLEDERKKVSDTLANRPNSSQEEAARAPSFSALLLACFLALTPASACQQNPTTSSLAYAAGDGTRAGHG